MQNYFLRASLAFSVNILQGFLQHWVQILPEGHHLPIHQVKSGVSGEAASHHCSLVKTEVKKHQHHHHFYLSKKPKISLHSNSQLIYQRVDNA